MKYYFSGQITPAVMPEFLFPLENQTVIQGRDIVFTCVVEHLQGFKVQKFFEYFNLDNINFINY